MQAVTRAASKGAALFVCGDQTQPTNPIGPVKFAELPSHPTDGIALIVPQRFCSCMWNMPIAGRR
jgi:hypothetical protein